jgi:hypothetical protein
VVPISCGTSGVHTASASGGPTTFTLDPTTDFATSETCTVTVHAANVTDQDTNDPPDVMAGDYVFGFTTEVPVVVTPIHDIQGSSHLSPLSSQTVTTLGTVTAKSANGFWMQDPNPDADPSTSEGIFVFTSSTPAVNVGDALRVRGRVQEFRPAGTSSANLTTTELANSPTITVVSTGNPLPPATTAGTGGRIPPDQVIEDDATGGSVENSGSVFDPASDGLDFWESLEGMRVQLNNPVAVGPTNAFGETPAIGDDGANASVRTYRGGILLHAERREPGARGRGQPARLTAEHERRRPLRRPAGRRPRLQLRQLLPRGDELCGSGAIHDGVTPETTDPAGLGQLAVSTFNFENLDPTDPQSKFDRLAGEIVDNLQSPDVIAGEEVQDSNGPTDNGVVDPTQTLNQLVTTIQAHGGPAYDWREIDPVNDQDGGGARRQHPAGLPLPHRSRPVVHRPRGRRLDDPDGGHREWEWHAAQREPRPHRSEQPGLECEPQAAGWRVLVQRPPPVRDRQPLQLEGGRQPADGSLSSHRSAARRCSATSRRRSSTTSSARSRAPTRTRTSSC